MSTVLILLSYLSKPFTQLIAITLGILAAPAMANQTVDDVFSISLEQLMKVEITGSTLTEENIRTVPSAVTVFTHKQIMRLGLDSLHELINLVPGFQPFRSSSTSLINPYSSRGRGAGNAFLVLVDGQRMQDPRTGDSTSVIFDFPLARIQRVEFLRGPGSAVYGSNAMTGMINIITRSNANEVNVGFGSFARRQVSTLMSKQLGNVKFDFFGRYDADNGEDYNVQDTFNSNRINTDDPRELAEMGIKLQWKHTQIHFEHRQIEVDNFYMVDRLSNGFNRSEANYSSVSLKQEFDWRSVSSWFLLA